MSTMTKSAFTSTVKEIFTFRWNPGNDLIAVVVSWVLVVAALYAASEIVGVEVWGGMAYFILYGVVGATLFGIGIPLYWTVAVRKRPVADLGITRRLLGVSFILQLVFSVPLYMVTLGTIQLPPIAELLPLIALALAIGFFEAVFWRGWVLLRLEAAFGIIPAILLGSILYAAYHIGYGMPASEMVFLFFIGVIYSVAFRLTKSIWILWPIFQPMGQLVTLIRDGLSLPLLAALGFAEVLALMLVLVWLASRYYNKHRLHQAAAVPRSSL